MENPYYLTEQFSKIMAWIDLLLLATHKDRTIIIKGRVIELKRGQLAYSIKSLSKRWKWSYDKANRYANELEISKQISVQKNNVTTIISITNYDDYQTDKYADDETNKYADKQADKQQTINKQDNNNKKLPKGSKKGFVMPTLDDISDELMAIQGNENAKLDFYNYWSAKDGNGTPRYMHQTQFYTKARFATWLKNEAKYESQRNI